MRNWNHEYIFPFFSDFKSLKTVNLFLEVFSHLKAYILLINRWLYVQFKVDKINYLIEKEIKPIDFCQQRTLTASPKKLRTNSVIEWFGFGK